MSLTAFSVPSDDCSLNLGDIDDLERLLGKGVSGAAARRKCELKHKLQKPEGEVWRLSWWAALPGSKGLNI